MTAWAIETRGLTRDFGKFRAVDGIDLRVPPGCFFGFLGPNGAGKSTTIKMLTGLLHPTAGDAFILGTDIAADPVAAKQHCGVVPEGLNLFDRLTADEYLTFVGRAHGLDRDTVRKRSAELLELMDLTEVGGSLIGDYSTGMRKKTAMAAALIHNPPVYFLDEPFEGIDAIVSKQIRDALQNVVKHGATIFLTSHVLEIVDRLCTHVGIIHKGKIVAQGAVNELSRGGHEQSVEDIFLSVVGGSDADARELSWLGGGNDDTTADEDTAP